MLIIRSSIAALVLVAGSSFAIAQTAAPAAPANPAAAATAAAPAAQPDANHGNPAWMTVRNACKRTSTSTAATSSASKANGVKCAPAWIRTRRT